MFKHRDLSLVLRIHGEKPSVVVYNCDSSIGEEEIGGALGPAGQTAWWLSVDPRQVKDSIL